MKCRVLAVVSAALLVVILVTLMSAPGAWAQSTYKTLYRFTGGAAGWAPNALIFDQAGSLYGMTSVGGLIGDCHLTNNGSCGVVFKLTPNPNGSWTESVLHSFTGGADGGAPFAGLIFDQAGNLYGTTNQGGNGYGVVFELTQNPDGSWTENVLHTFCSLTNCDDGRYAEAGLIFDTAGNLYGTTVQGGGSSYCSGGCGVVFKLTSNPDGSWTESVLHSLMGGNDGVSLATGSLIFDTTGNLYGTTTWGGGSTACGFGGCGTVFRLTPNPDGSWTESLLHSFRGGKDGSNPWAGLIFDGTGDLYGTTTTGGAYSAGMVFELIPNPDGSWKEKLLHLFTGGKDGGAPYGGLIFDQAGNLYGMTEAGGAGGYGVVFKLTPNSNGGWNQRLLWTFADHPGAYPAAGLIFDAAGNLYGTTQGDGTTTFGSVFEITP